MKLLTVLNVEFVIFFNVLPLFVEQLPKINRRRISFNNFIECNIFLFLRLLYNVYVYEKLRVCVRGFSEGKSEASKRATDFGLALI